MNVTFLATVNLDDLSDLPGVATEINDDLTQAGFEVISVTPWARPATAPTVQGALGNPAVPTQTQPINPNIT